MLGARKVSQIEDSLQYLSLDLPADDMQALNELMIRQLATGGMLDAIDNEHLPA